MRCISSDRGTEAKAFATLCILLRSVTMTLAMTMTTNNVMTAISTLTMATTASAFSSLSSTSVSFRRTKISSKFHMRQRHLSPFRKSGFVPVRDCTTASILLSSASKDHLDASEDLHVVLYNVGDLRTCDHDGLMKATTSRKSVRPLFILDPERIQNVPGARSHPVETGESLK